MQWYIWNSQKKNPRIFPPKCFRLASSWSIIPPDVVITINLKYKNNKWIAKSWQKLKMLPLKKNYITLMFLFIPLGSTAQRLFRRAGACERTSKSPIPVTQILLSLCDHLPRWTQLWGFLWPFRIGLYFQWSSTESNVITSFRKKLLIIYSLHNLQFNTDLFNKIIDFINKGI